MLKTASVNESVNSRELINSLTEKLIIGGPINFPNKYGNFNLFYFKKKKDEKEKKADECHLVLIKRDIKQDSNKSIKNIYRNIYQSLFNHNNHIQKNIILKNIPLVRLHSECLTGDALCSLRCDCMEQLHESLKQISESSSGILIYLRQEGRGIGLFSKLQAYELQDTGLDTVQANIQLGYDSDMRDYGIAAAILNYFHIGKIKLLTNNPGKINSLEEYGIKVIERVPLKIAANKFNENYLKIKKDKLGHLL